MHTGVFVAGLVLMLLAFLVFLGGASSGIMGLIGGFIIASFLGLIGFIMFFVGLIINPKVTVVTTENRQVLFQQTGPTMYCPHCGTANPEKHEFCFKCGSKLP